MVHFLHLDVRTEQVLTTCGRTVSRAAFDPLSGRPRAGFGGE